MQKGITIQELARQVDARSRQKQDYIALANKLTVTPTGGAGLALRVPEFGEYPLQPVAERQLTTMLGIPAQYFDRCKADGLADLAAINANAWLKHKPIGNRMVRTLGPNARAVLSPKYQRVDDVDVLKVALPVLKELPGVEIVSAQITETRMYVQFVLPKFVGEVKKGDAIQLGGVFSNSEVGHGRISVAGLIWRLWCLNGAIGSDHFARSHIGREIEDNDDLWSEETQKLDDRLILSRVRDMVKAVTDEARARLVLGRLQDLAKAKIDGDPRAAVTVLAQKVGASDAEGDAIFKSLLREDAGGRIDLTAWGMLNAVTAQAHTVASYDRAVELERIGGKLIDMPASEWREVLQAA